MVEIHPNWYTPAEQLHRNLRVEFRAASIPIMRERIRKAQAEHGTLDNYRAHKAAHTP